MGAHNSRGGPEAGDRVIAAPAVGRRLGSLLPALTAIFFLTVAASAYQASPQKSGVAPPASRTAVQSTEDAAAREAETMAWDILVKGVAERQSLKRARAIAALGAVGVRPEVVKLIEAGLADKDSGVRQAAATTLGEMKSRGSIPKLQQAMDDKSPAVAFAAARALWDMGERSGRSLFLSILAGEHRPSSGVVRSNVADAKKKMQDPGGLALMGAKEFLGPFGLGVGVMEELVKDRSAPSRALSATLLASDPDPQAAQQLEAALADKNWIVRAAAAKALGQRTDRPSIPKLKPLLNDAKDAVRYAAAASIVRLSRARPRPKP